MKVFDADGKLVATDSPKARREWVRQVPGSTFEFENTDLLEASINDKFEALLCVVQGRIDGEPRNVLEHLVLQLNLRDPEEYAARLMGNTL